MWVPFSMDISSARIPLLCTPVLFSDMEAFIMNQPVIQDRCLKVRTASHYGWRDLDQDHDVNACVKEICERRGWILLEDAMKGNYTTAEDDEVQYPYANVYVSKILANIEPERVTEWKVECDIVRKIDPHETQVEYNYDALLDPTKLDFTCLHLGGNRNTEWVVEFMNGPPRRKRELFLMDFSYAAFESHPKERLEIRAKGGDVLMVYSGLPMTNPQLLGDEAQVIHHVDYHGAREIRPGYLTGRRMGLGRGQPH
ncbi:hypothetical protein N7G274_006561 [Stereocaulon virgatum]|uniref:Uncharacterized protein n=1 Tax=Stereocaulon virgatum TaxID=373712 RepID=A0ABR4A3T3_9LECA